MQEIKNLYAKLISYWNRKAYEKAMDDSLATSLFMQIREPVQIEWNRIPKHPLFDQCIIDFKKQIKSTMPLDTINFGDSLTAMSNEWMDQLDGKFAISGSWHRHMDDVAGTLYPLLQDKQVKYVAVGTLGGNPLLVYQDYDRTVEYSLKTLDRMRELFPLAKIIVYGLPPVFNIHATSHTICFDLELIKWVSKDGNATFIELKNKFGGLFPKVKWSRDGVHLTPRGAVKLNALFKKAKTTKEKVI